MDETPAYPHIPYGQALIDEYDNFANTGIRDYIAGEKVVQGFLAG